MLSAIASTLRVVREDMRRVTTLEYGLIASLIAVTIITAVGIMGQGLNTAFGFISAKL